MFFNNIITLKTLFASLGKEQESLRKKNEQVEEIEENRREKFEC